MTREDLANKRVKELRNQEEAIEFINCLTYDECLEILNRSGKVPHKLFLALAERAKKQAGKVTPELVIAMMQYMVNNADKFN